MNIEIGAYFSYGEISQSGWQGRAGGEESAAGWAALSVFGGTNRHEFLVGFLKGTQSRGVCWDLSQEGYTGGGMLASGGCGFTDRGRG